eukprot:gene1152-1461_t
MSNQQKTNDQKLPSDQRPRSSKSSTSSSTSSLNSTSKSRDRPRKSSSPSSSSANTLTNNEVPVVKILKRNDDNIDPDKINKMFTAKLNGSGEQTTGTTSSTKIDSTKVSTTSKSTATPTAAATVLNTTNAKLSSDRKKRRFAKNQKPSSSSSSPSSSSLKKKSELQKQYGRILGELPIQYDLDTVSFSGANAFQKNDIVLVPRSRGGFTYGKVQDIIMSSVCHHDSSVSHPGAHYRAVYPSGAKKENLFKDLPSSYLGKLVSIDNLPPNVRSFKMQQPSQQQQQQEPNTYTIGQKASLKDLQNLVFSPSSKFQPNQIVLVPRSKGGFTYGCVLKECKVPCKVEHVKHEISGYRVVVEKTLEHTIIKDLIVGNLGKIFTSLENPIIKYSYHDIIAKPLVQPDSASTTTTTTTAGSLPSPKLNNVEQQHQQLPKMLQTPIPAEVNTQQPILQTPASIMNNPVESSTTTTTPATITITPGTRGVFEVPSDSIIFQKGVGRSKKPATSLIIIDGPNVAKRYGNKKKFYVLALKKALDYYSVRGYDVVAFVPESYAYRKPANDPKRNFTLFDFNDVADDLEGLHKLVESGQVCLTPPQDYDDSYAIQYARRQNACIVTNDRYHDHIERGGSPAEKAKIKRFIREHCISFTFVRNEFLPNPDFKFPMT